MVRHGPERARLIAAWLMAAAVLPLLLGSQWVVGFVAGFAACFAVMVARSGGDEALLRVTRLLVAAAVLLGALQV